MIQTPPPAAARSLELWGGLECTVVRIRNRTRNQIAETGHLDRIADLDAIAALGLRTLRYPVLWETVAPDDPDRPDWRWHDERLHRLRALGIAPIAGLMHHGSGPAYTDLLDPALPEMLARHAARVAERYPWIDRYTPVNEPLTTARFSGLYGHWQPHGRDTQTFLRTLVVQCRAVVLAMRAIRRINPAAQLVQTEDLGKVFATPRLRYQADYENERRWLSLDLLCGRIDRRHPWHEIFVAHGVGEDELDCFVAAPCVPDIVGINHYLTSERYLDHRVEDYPACHAARNGRHAYADVEAVRAGLPPGDIGPQARLREAWGRYGLPLAVTEAHHGGPRDEQLRWLIEVWNAATTLRAQDVDLRAVTVWSLLGCVDWNSLLVESHRHYECGVFDTRCTPPRPTALARAATALATSGRYEHPVLDSGGWWRRNARPYRPAPTRASTPAPAVLAAPPRCIAIAGATGTLGQAFARVCEHRGLPYELLRRADMDIADAGLVEAALALHRPWAVINAAGYVRVDHAEHEADRCFRENTFGAETVARACARLGIPYVTFSSDLVFDGQLGRAYIESDSVCPRGTYGESKAEAERRVAEVWPQALVIRTSAFFGPWDRFNFVHAALRALAAGQRIEASDEIYVSPTYVPDLANGVLDLLIDGTTGVWHLANQGEMSWHELALRAARAAGVAAASLRRTRDGDRGVTALTSERGLILPHVDGAIERFVRERAFA